MFAFLRGTVCDIDSDRLVLDVSGVGYELQASNKTLEQLTEEETILLYTYFHLSQDAVSLYGFSTKQEKQMFRRLISISRIGPKAALAALSMLDVAVLATAIATGDEETLSHVPGWGKKTAQRIVLELKEKIAKEDLADISNLNSSIDFASVGNSMQNEAITALMALGYDRNTAMNAVGSVTESCERVEQLITLSLKQLAR